MFKDLDTVVFTRNLDKYGLEKGDVGTIVHSYAEEKALEVEVVRADGKTVAVLTVKPSDVRYLASSEILKVRELSLANN